MRMSDLMLAESKLKTDLQAIQRAKKILEGLNVSFEPVSVPQTKKRGPYKKKRIAGTRAAVYAALVSIPSGQHFTADDVFNLVKSSLPTARSISVKSEVSRTSRTPNCGYVRVNRDPVSFTVTYQKL